MNLFRLFILWLWMITCFKDYDVNGDDDPSSIHWNAKRYQTYLESFSFSQYLLHKEEAAKAADNDQENGNLHNFLNFPLRRRVIGNYEKKSEHSAAAAKYSNIPKTKLGSKVQLNLKQLAVKSYLRKQNRLVERVFTSSQSSEMRQLSPNLKLSITDPLTHSLTDRGRC